MKTIEEWEREFWESPVFEIKKSIEKLIEMVREEALEEAAKAVRRLDDGDFNHTTIRLNKAILTIQNLKEKP